jgi:hypothetical protein
MFVAEMYYFSCSKVMLIPEDLLLCQSKCLRVSDTKCYEWRLWKLFVVSRANDFLVASSNTSSFRSSACDEKYCVCMYRYMHVYMYICTYCNDPYVGIPIVT